ncbi:MAG: type I restriction endonuclease subunit R [Rhodobacteraceae bacterium]|nr:type I restriction endonuclease subunit R [Paracoccaceae bacterium]
MNKNNYKSTNPEQKLEEDFVRKLQKDLKYIYRDDIRNREALERNFRKKFQELNRVTLTDGEFRRLLEAITTRDVFKAAKALRNRETFIRDDGTPLNYNLVNTKDWCKNTYEVVNQFRINTDYSQHRYDIIILLNGVPVVQIELKRPGISSSRAMEQIVNYKNDPGNGYTRTLLCFIQLFIVSNRTDTWYFPNNNSKHFPLNSNERHLPIYWFADSENKKITHLDDFAVQFLAKCSLGEMINKYMVLVANEEKLLIMRPYQIYAVKAIIHCINQYSGNGYIWHTTGSGKTLTSFKAAILLKNNPNIHKCLFVVDRKDLDRQTREEFNKFQENCVEENTNTATLVQRLQSNNHADKVIVTTIQKLGLALEGNLLKEQLQHLSEQRMVFIFDECHRSQFGKNHQTIKKNFPNSQFFGFTGTPIFEENSKILKVEGQSASMKTTKDLFQQLLHKYTITHAIEDETVLRFHVDYYEEKDINDHRYKRKVVEEILENHNALTGKRHFNALFATSSINDAIDYYQIFNEAQADRRNEDADFKPLKIAAIFSPPAEGNKDIKQFQESLDQEREDNRRDPEDKKEALTTIINNYNQLYDVTNDIRNFDSYYQDIQQRIKDQKFPNKDLPGRGSEKIDITIVCDMLLTGFDAKFLNTLYLDKNLRYHNLIQAFSRTNRILNRSKPFGNILDFRGQRERVDEAIKLFSGVNIERARKIWLVEEAPAVISFYKEAVNNLEKFMLSQGLETTPEQVNNLLGNASRIQFINLFREIRRLRTQLSQYTDLSDEQKDEIEKILNQDDINSFQGSYLETIRRLKEKGTGQSGDRSHTPDEELPDFELNLFSSADIDYDYIMHLIADYTNMDPKKARMTRDQLIGLIRADAKFLEDGEDIIEYVNSLREGEGLDETAIREGFDKFRVEKQARQIAMIAKNHGISPHVLTVFVDNILDRMFFDGEQLTDLMAPLGLGWRERRKQELSLMQKLIPLLKKRGQNREIPGLNAYERQVEGNAR